MHLDHLPGSLFGPSTLIELLRHRAEHQALDISFQYMSDGEQIDIEWTYADLDRKARSIATRLLNMNLEGERALLLYPSGLDFVAAFFGCLYAGVTAVPAYPPRRNRNMARIESIAGDAEAKIALTTGDVLERVQTMIGDTPTLQQIRWRATDGWDDSLADEWQRPDVHGETLAFLQYTSGTTGTPKGVMLSHANLMHNSAMISYAFEHTRSGCSVFWLPLYHDMGLIGGILQPIYIGKVNILFSPTHFLQKPVRWLQNVSHFGATISGGPNFAYDLCVEKVTAEQKRSLDLSRWALAFNGAEPVRAESIDRFSQAFAECGFRREAFYPCYGLAEATLIVAGGYKESPPTIRSFDSAALENNRANLVVPPQAGEPAAGSHELVGSGGNLLDQQIVVADPETYEPREDEQIGEIWISSPSVAQGYWKRQELTEATFHAYLKDGRGPFLRSGDLGFLREGELFVTGRQKDLIILRGVNHYPQDLELTVQAAHNAGRQGAVAAFVVGESGQERLVIVQEANRRRDIHFAASMEAIRKQIASQHELAVSAIVLLKPGSIPKTSSGKIQRHACRAGYLAGTLAALATWSAETGQVEIIRSARRKRAQTPQKDPPETTTFKQTLPMGSPHEEKEPEEKGPGKSLPAERNGKPAPATGTALEPSPSGQAAEIAEIVYEHVQAVGRERARNLSWNTNIVELGLDSLERMEIIAGLEEAFGGRFPEQAMADMETCGQVVEAIETHLGDQLKEHKPRSADYVVPEEDYQFNKSAEYLGLQENLQLTKKAGLANPFFNVHEGITDDRTTIGGREYINFCSYNYLGMSGDPTVIQAANEATRKYGTSVSASRLVSGEKPLHRQLERAIADFLGTEDSIVFVGGHATNESTIGHLFGTGDLILHDALSHNSILQGALLSGARRRPFPHNDWHTCGRLLEQFRHEYRRVLIVIEGIYSMDGDYPDLPHFIEIKKRHKTYLMVDEAHSLGTMGLHGRGISEHYGVNPRDVDIWMGTLSKSLGSCGGYISGAKTLVEYLKYTAPGFVYSVGLSPPNTAAALAALELLQEEPERVARLNHNAHYFLKLARQAELNTGLSNNTAVVPVITGNSEHALRLSHQLHDRGINVQPILYPAVEERAARLRFFITSSHTDEQIRTTVAAVAEEWNRIDGEGAVGRGQEAVKKAESRERRHRAPEGGVVKKAESREQKT